VNLTALVELHRQYLNVPQSLPENLGDGYLCQHNTLYRNVRQRALECGTRFLMKETDIWLFDISISQF
jgi:hypothetical protein